MTTFTEDDILRAAGIYAASTFTPRAEPTPDAGYETFVNNLLRLQRSSGQPTTFTGSIDDAWAQEALANVAENDNTPTPEHPRALKKDAAHFMHAVSSAIHAMLHRVIAGRLPPIV